jgi:hypothetical protein
VTDSRLVRPALPLLLAVLLGLPSTAFGSAPQISDVFARSATRAMVATRLGVGSIGVERHLFDLRCHRVRASTIGCSWSFGPNLGLRVAYGEGQVTILPPVAKDAPPRYRYDFSGEVARRKPGSPPAYRVRRFHWRYTSPDHVQFARGVTQRFQRFADAAIADSPYAGAAQTAGPACEWSLLDDRTVAANCAADYRGFRDGQPCMLRVDGTWAEGHLTVGTLDDAACASSPG